MTVKCPGDDFDIVTKTEVWENISYSIDSETKAITENKIGSFTQIPLRLAWSITIHKSQGLTFEKAIIDAQGAFAHGQTYVALSRCKSLEGLVLKSKIHSSQIISDRNVISFNKSAEDNPVGEEDLNKSKSLFQLNLIAEIFDFYKLLYPINRILDVYYKNRGSIEGNIETPIITIKDCITSLLKIGNGFKSQLKNLTTSTEPAESNDEIQERFIKAIDYFTIQTRDIISVTYNVFSFTTDNKTIEKDLNKLLDDFEALLVTKESYFRGLSEKFVVKTFLELRAKSVFLAKGSNKETKTICCRWYNKYRTV